MTDQTSGNEKGMKLETVTFISFPQNAIDYHTVDNERRGTPNNQATILGSHRALIADTRSNSSLIQYAVCSSEVRPTSMPHLM